MSLMGGMTPLYAPPEVFDGHPSLHSDQYSLAIVYQQMLTGEPPFRGRTPSQLISQHLYGNPHLAALPASDQPVISRALSKDPSQRFSSCGAMIEALLKAEPPPAAGSSLRTSTVEALFAPQPKQQSSQSTSASSAVVPRTWTARGRAPAAKSPADLSRRRPSPAEEAAAVETLTPIEIPAGEIGLRPTLVLGIGGTGARALQQFCRRLRDRFGNIAAVPAVRTLLVDTDVKTIARATEARDGRALASEDTLVMPLRKRHDYRADSDQFLQWFSRRWLYNIPHSLQTEGIRPLGRLALVDHADRLFDRLWAAFAAMTTPEALAATTEATGLPMRSHAPRVFIVASISGGTGSGMVLDVGYAVRMVLATLGVAGDAVCGILTHSTGRSCDAKDLAIASAHACLNELHHYNRVGRYSGDPACHLPSDDENRGAFDSTYLVHMGDGLSESEVNTGTDVVAEYLYLNSVTGAGAFFDKCRQATRTPVGTPHPDMQLRTFGLYQIDCSQSTMPVDLAKLFCRQVVSRWCKDAGAVNRPGGADPPPPPAAGSDAPESEGTEPLGAEDSQAGPDLFVAKVCEIARKEEPGEAERYLQSCLEQDADGRDAARAAVFRTLSQANIAELLLDSGNGPQESSDLLRVLLEAAAPALLHCGGSQRLLLVCADKSSATRLKEVLQRQLDQKPSVAHASDGDLVLCYEGQGISLASVAARLIDNRADYAQVASRLHTRIDVFWSSLPSIP